MTSGMVLGDQEAPDRWVGRQGYPSWAETQELRVEGGRLKLGVGSLTLPMTTWLLGVIVFYWSRHPSAYREETRFR